MNKQKKDIFKIIRRILGFLMIGSFLFFIIGEVTLPAENASGGKNCEVFQTDWVEIMPDGSKVPVTVPGTCETERGEWVTIVTTLPGNQEDTCICIRSMQQELKIYVGDELRKEYSTLDTQPFGKTSTMTYVFFEIYDSDAGKELRVEFMSDSNYAGYVSEMYIGEYSDIKEYFFSQHLPSTIVAMLMFILGLFVVVGSIFVRIFYKREVELLYLGHVILIASTWLLVESKLRQFIFPNSTMAMLMGFLMVALLPYPFLSYVNSIQKRRHQKAFTILGILTALNFIVVVTLQVLNIKDFFETMMSSHIMIVYLIVLMAITVVIDVVKGHWKDYREVVIGFVGVMVGGICEICLSYIVAARLNGIALCAGLVILLITEVLKSIRDMFEAEREKQVAIAAGESKAKFLANMSHEIRTPINTVIGMNEMILRENKDETIKGYAVNIKSASQMLLGLINDVLDFSKIEAGKLKIVENDYYLANMLNDAILAVELRAKQKNLEIKLDIDETMPTVLKGDDIRIKQILNNLLSNAIKYTEKGSITLSARGVRDENGFALRLAVEDTGIGIKKEDMEKLFASFQRLELAKNRYIEGTGLGLNITKQLVSLMSGTIDVQSEYGVGSCFIVQIPQQVVDDAPMGKPERNPRVDIDEQASKKEPLYAPDAKILVVDDTPMNLMVIEELLKRSCVQLDQAGGGDECLQMTAKKKYDLILMDHMMPKPDGVQTMHIIREDNNNINQKTPIVVLTANAIEGMKEEYLSEGFEGYLSKPVDVDELEDTIAYFLGQKK